MQLAALMSGPGGAAPPSPHAHPGSMQQLQQQPFAPPSPPSPLGFALSPPPLGAYQPLSGLAFPILAPPGLHGTPYGSLPLPYGLDSYQPVPQYDGPYVQTATPQPGWPWPWTGPHIDPSQPLMKVPFSCTPWPLRLHCQPHASVCALRPCCVLLASDRPRGKAL
jgi:hypothetical protein